MSGIAQALSGHPLGFAGAFLLIVGALLSLAGRGIIVHKWITPGKETARGGMMLAVVGALVLLVDASNMLPKAASLVTDRSVQKESRKVNPPPPPPPRASVPTLGPSESLLLIFTSGGSNETGRQRVGIESGDAGKYVVSLESANPVNSGCWIVWDYIALMDGETPVWEIGKDEAPTDYSERAFSEFCDPAAGGSCLTEYTVGSTRDGDFCKDLNDGRFPLANIHFTLNKDQASRQLILVLGTLYSTHDGAEHFRMKVTLRKG